MTTPAGSDEPLRRVRAEALREVAITLVDNEGRPDMVAFLRDRADAIERGEGGSR